MMPVRRMSSFTILSCLTLTACPTPDPGCLADDTTLWYVDADNDGLGDLTAGEARCDDPGEGWSKDPGDCDDGDASMGAGAWFYDADGDGLGAGEPYVGCERPNGHAALDGDCDDNDPTVTPTATEACDGKDNDCDEQIDEGVQTVTCYPDDDDDGHGSATAAPQVLCDACPPGTIEDATDCEDSSEQSYPGATESCDGLDNDCDPVTWVDQGASNCAAGVFPAQDPATGQVYLLSTGPSSRNDLASYCASRGYHLAWLDSADEATFLAGAMTDAGAAAGPHWTGLEWSRCTPGTYERVDAMVNPVVCAPLGAWEQTELSGAVTHATPMLEATGALVTASPAPSSATGICELAP